MKKHKWLETSYISLMMAFLYAPILVLMIFSFNDSKSRNVWSGFTLHWYRDLFHDQEIISALMITLLIAFASAAIATVLGTAAAIGLNKMNRKLKSVVMTFTTLPMVNPDIITGVSLMLLFIYLRVEFGLSTLILAHVTFSVPYVILNVMPKLRTMDKHTYEAAMDLGCNPVQAFFKVVIPEIMPGIMSGFLMALTFSMDDFVISYFVGGASVQTLPVAIWSQTRRRVTPKINALSTIIFVVVVAVLVISNIHSARKEKMLREGRQREVRQRKVGE